MKKLILSGLIFCCIYPLFAQHYDLPSKTLGQKFASKYGDTKKEKDLFERLYETSHLFFSGSNETLVNAITGLQRKYKLSADSAIHIVYDTVMLSFTNDHLWDESSDIKKYFPYLEYYNSRLCPCIAEKFNRSAFHRLEEKDITECAQDVLKDTSFLNHGRQLMASFTMDDRYIAAGIGIHYMFQQCAAFHDFYSGIIRYPTHSLKLELIDAINGRDETVLQLYRDKSPKLAKIFPSYKKFETDLRSADELSRNKEAAFMFNKSTDATGKLTIAKTYYRRKNDKPVLIGQIVFVLKEEIAGSPVLSFRSTPAVKMKDREKLLAKIAEEEIVEPPPGPPMVEMKIDVASPDTLKKKN